LIDDLSTDKTVEIVEKEIENDERFVLIKNAEKGFALKNIYDAILSSNPNEEDVIVTVDGDDWLANQNVLEILDTTYNREDCWMTYGSYVEYPSGNRGKFSRQISQQVIDNSSYRSSEWCASHLRTFKFHLWSKINRQDLIDRDGNFYRMSWDLSFMFPMLEMSGQRAKYINEILYCYNLSNPINDHKTDHRLQLLLESEIRQKKKYDLL
jgi:glycosyltransferase involved in cell wall biosynthesis